MTALWFALTTLALLAGCAGPLPRHDACADGLSPAIRNGCVVHNNVLWRGAQPDAAAASELLRLGVRTVVNLELLHDDQDAFRGPQPALGEPRSLGYFRVREWEPNVVVAPAITDGHVADFIAIMRTQAKPVYVHCRSGQNRTGVMVAAFRILEQNMASDDAIAEMMAYQGVWAKHDAAYLRGLVGQRRQQVQALVADRVAKVRPLALLDCTAGGCVPR